MLLRHLCPLVLALSLSQGACTYITAVSQTNLPQQRSHKVEASTYKFIFLGFNFDNDEVLALTSQLKTKCPGGKVQGVLTKDMRTLYFLFFFWARQVTATGYCQPSVNVARMGDDLIETDLIHAPAMPSMPGAPLEAAKADAGAR